MRTATRATVRTTPGAHSDVAAGSETTPTPRRTSTLAWWPMDRGGLGLLVLAYAVGTALWTGAGLLLVHVVDHSAFHRSETDLSRWFEDHRTPRLDNLSHLGSMASDTVTKLIAVPLLAALFVVVWRRWHDALFLVTAMLLEVSVFATSTLLVGRDRPPVEQLDGSLPTHSYPSGHVAAAVTFYVGLLLIIGWHTRSRWLRAAATVVAIAMPTIVATSRLYRGMHYLSDVLAGALLGAAVLVTTMAVLRITAARMTRDHGNERPPQELRELDLTPGGSPS